MYLEEIYLELGNRLLSNNTKQLLEQMGLPPIAHVDLYEGQYLSEEKEEVYHLPAVFIEFSNTTSSKIKGNGVQQNTETIRLHIEQAKLESTAMNRANQTKALLPLRMVDAIHILMSGGFLGLYPVGRELDTEHNGYPVHILEYEGIFKNTDTSKFKEHQETKIERVKIDKSVKYRL
ncbi:hypothetical protein [uncultured Microscilla sp.]|uniref:hypothetical protein n=1 Tax=uncultured Microscilla sp. TaxID=432653 RepID=UPI0026378385|nr:hypothetical protein [uncultured Microscilla sp.]